MTEEEKNKLFAENLRFLRRQACLTQENLSNELGVDPRTIQRWESAKEKPPKSENLQNIADLFDVSIDDLLNTDIKQKTVKKAVGKSTVSKEPLSAMRVKTQKEKLAKTLTGLSEVLTRDF